MAKYTVRVYHSYYGCDTGCCGHTIEVQDEDGKELHSSFEFTHPYGDDKTDLAAWARREAEDTIRAHWPDCVKSIDWSTLDVSEVLDD